MIKRSLLSLIVLLAIAATTARAADVLYPNTGASNPSSGNIGTLVEQGKKGILLTMQCLDAGGNVKTDCWPIANGSPSLSINGGAAIACANTLNPPANGCGFAIGAFTAADPNVDTFKIVYNGIFPNNAAITATVNGATGNAGSTEPNCPGGGDPGCVLSFTAGANTPRANTSTELIFDISGSMGLAATQTDTTHTRIQRLIEAANAFLVAYQPDTMLGDKLGAVVFSTTASSLTPGSPNFVSGFDPAQVASVQAQINTQTPTNLTAIGDGLTKANSLGFAADAGSPNTKWAILFTDGEQNVPGPSGNVAATATQVTVGGTTYSTGTNKLAGPGQIALCPVTAGLQTSNGFALQQAIANALCDSQNGYIGIVTDFTTYFAQLLTTVLQGDKFEVSRDIAATVTATPSVVFLGNGLDRSFEIILTHDPAAERAGYVLVAPDGTNVPLTPVRFATGSVAKVELPVMIGKKRLPTQGPWKIVLNPGTFGKAPDYHLMVINDNPTISTTYTTLGTDLGTGDPLQVRVAALDASKPLTNATMSVDIVGPGFGLGNVLSTTPASGDLPNLLGDSGGSPGAQKLLILANNPKNARSFGTVSRGTVKLTSCGPDRHWDPAQEKGHPPIKGCEHADPIRTVAPGGTAAIVTPATAGIYAGTYSNSALEGHYFFTFHVSGTSAGNGPFERTWKIALFVRPKPYGPKTPVVVRAIQGDPKEGFIATLHVTPHDKLNNFLGPGYDGALRFVNGSTPIPFTTDNLDGSYEFQVRTPPGDPKLTLQTLSQPVKTIDLTNAKAGGTL